jgi:hypothetical protein
MPQSRICTSLAALLLAGALVSPTPVPAQDAAALPLIEQINGGNWLDP